MRLILVLKSLKGESENEKISNIELYEGGTGKKEGTPLTWEIKDNILSITENYYNMGTATKGYKIENETMSSVDGEVVYHKSK